MPEGKPSGRLSFISFFQLQIRVVLDQYPVMAWLGVFGNVTSFLLFALGVMVNLEKPSYKFVPHKGEWLVARGEGS